MNTESIKLAVTRRMRSVVVLFLVAITLYLLAVSPVHAYFEQRKEVHAAEQRYQVLSKANQQLSSRVDLLQSDQEIERLARERYELVSPGEQAYAVMPPPAAPPQPAKKKAEGFFAKVGDAITFWN